MHIISLAEKAMLEAGVKPLIMPIRGGTDGANLSFKGLPCPNILQVDITFTESMNMFPSKRWKKQQM